VIDFRVWGEGSEVNLKKRPMEFMMGKSLLKIMD
jgi:hypothetical protein